MKTAASILNSCLHLYCLWLAIGWLNNCAMSGVDVGVILALTSGAVLCEMIDFHL